MINLKYNKEDLRYLFIVGDNRKEIKILMDYLNKIPQYMFLPSFKGIPKPEVFMHVVKNTNNSIYYCHSGLWKEICDFCAAKNIKVNGVFDDDYFKYTKTHGTETLEEFKEWALSLDLNIKPRDYQIKAAYLILNFRQSLSQLATRSGKTLIAYIIFRYMLEKMNAKKILMVVPSISLVKQGVADMSEYKEFFKTEQVWAKSELCESSNLTIGTFQSLVKRLDRNSKSYNPNFFKDYDVVCIDEAHTAKCKSINLILSQNFIKNCKLKFGFSGSLPESGTIDSFCVQSLIGPRIQDITSIELMNQGFITPVDITQIYIDHNNESDLDDKYIQCAEYLCSNYITIKELIDSKDASEELKSVFIEEASKNPKVLTRRVELPKSEQCFTMVHKKVLPYSLRLLKNNLERLKKLTDKDAVALMEYTQKFEEYKTYLIDLCKANGSNLLVLEQMLVHRDEHRMNTIKNLVKSFNKNCIIFAHHSEYLNYIYETLKNEFKGKKVFMIKGSTGVKQRGKIIEALLESNNCVLVASYGCVGTGLTLKNIDYGIFAQSFKSNIINTQSIGRGLCLANDKDVYKLYDLIDIYPTKRLYLQGLAKEKLYKRQKFTYNKKFE